MDAHGLVLGVQLHVAAADGEVAAADVDRDRAVGSQLARPQLEHRVFDHRGGVADAHEGRHRASGAVAEAQEAAAEHEAVAGAVPDELDTNGLVAAPAAAREAAAVDEQIPDDGDDLAARAPDRQITVVDGDVGAVDPEHHAPDRAVALDVDGLGEVQRAGVDVEGVRRHRVARVDDGAVHDRRPSALIQARRLVEIAVAAVQVGVDHAQVGVRGGQRGAPPVAVGVAGRAAQPRTGHGGGPVVESHRHAGAVEAAADLHGVEDDGRPRGWRVGLVGASVDQGAQLEEVARPGGRIVAPEDRDAGRDGLRILGVGHVQLGQAPLGGAGEGAPEGERGFVARSRGTEHPGGARDVDPGLLAISGWARGSVSSQSPSSGLNPSPSASSGPVGSGGSPVSRSVSTGPEPVSVLSTDSSSGAGQPMRGASTM